MNSRGFVVTANTRQSRIDEILKWTGDPWLPFLASLNIQLGELDPNYTIVQIKEKFSGLRFYYQTEIPGLRKRMDSLVTKTENEIWEYEKTKRRFDHNAVPPETPYEGFKF